MVIKVGDIFEIPLSNSRKAYGHYVFKDKMGPMISIFDLISGKKIQVERLREINPMFRPIITGLYAVIKKGIWRKIGNFPVIDFDYPNFIGTNYNQKTGKATIWFLWNGEKYIRLGSKLPEKYKKLEYLFVWSPFDVIHRIETGEYPFPYKDLIMYNQFTPNS